MPTADSAAINKENLGLKLIKHILFWPLWWYSSGLLVILKATGQRIYAAWKNLALDIWLKNIMRPMYGQYDTASRIISFIMRCFQIIFRFFIFLIMAAVIALFPVIYLAAPVLAIWQLFKY